jgi:hypothetical protein
MGELWGFGGKALSRLSINHRGVGSPSGLGENI